MPLDWNAKLAGGYSANDVLNQYVGSMDGNEITAILNQHGFKVASRTVRDKLTAIKRNIKSSIKSPSNPTATETQDRNEKNWTIELKGTRIKTLDEMINQCEVDLKEWRVDRFVVNKWEVGIRGDDGIEVEPLFQVKVWLERKVEIVNARAELDSLRTLAKSIISSPPKFLRTKSSKDYLLELSIPDVHFGKYASALETGWHDYNLEIAKKVYEDSVAALVSRTSAFEFREVCLVIGNDMLNFDGLDGATSGGTPQSNSSSYYRAFDVARDSIIRSTEGLRQVAPVKVIVVHGNHDVLSAWHLGDSVASYFHNYKDVVVDNAPTPKKYHQFGKVMLMWTHGDKGKRDEYPLAMAVEQPEMFGATKFRECHTGHHHKTKTDEYKGIRVRTLPSLTAVDEWHSENGFVGAIRSAEAFVWHREEGLSATAVYNVPMVK